MILKSYTRVVFSYFLVIRAFFNGLIINWNNWKEIQTILSRNSLIPEKFFFKKGWSSWELFIVLQAARIKLSLKTKYLLCRNLKNFWIESGAVRKMSINFFRLIFTLPNQWFIYFWLVPIRHFESETFTSLLRERKTIFFSPHWGTFFRCKINVAHHFPSVHQPQRNALLVDWKRFTYAPVDRGRYGVSPPRSYPFSLFLPPSRFSSSWDSSSLWSFTRIPTSFATCYTHFVCVCQPESVSSDILLFFFHSLLHSSLYSVGLVQTGLRLRLLLNNSYRYRIIQRNVRAKKDTDVVRTIQFHFLRFVTQPRRLIRWKFHFIENRDRKILIVKFSGMKKKSRKSDSVLMEKLVDQISISPDDLFDYFFHWGSSYPFQKINFETFSP